MERDYFMLQVSLLLGLIKLMFNVGHLVSSVCQTDDGRCCAMNENDYPDPRILPLMTAAGSGATMFGHQSFKHLV